MLSYKNKYLKYKNKYFNLKTQIGGTIEKECPICFQEYDNNEIKPVALHNHSPTDPEQHFICIICYNQLVNDECPLCRSLIENPKEYNYDEATEIVVEPFNILEVPINQEYQPLQIILTSDNYIDLNQSNSPNNLKYVNLHIIEINPDTFQNTRLNHFIIELAYNRLTQIHPYTFQNLTNLVEISLSHNQLTEIHPNTFQGLIHLEEIYLDYNQLEQIHPDTFQGLINLEVIFLRNNQLRYINPATFRDLPKLSVVKLEHNQLTRENIINLWSEYSEIINV